MTSAHKATKMVDGAHTIARLRHLITQRDLAERVVSIGVSLEPNEDGNMSIVVACPLLEDEKHADPCLILRITETIGVTFNRCFLRARETEKQRDELKAKVEELEHELGDAREEMRPVAEWCAAVRACVRVLENEIEAKIARWRGLGTTATEALEKLEAYRDGISAAYEAIGDIPGWTGYEKTPPGSPEAVLHHAVHLHEKRALAAEAELQQWREAIERFAVDGRLDDLFSRTVRK